MLTATERERILAFLAEHGPDDMVVAWAEDLQRHREGLRQQTTSLLRYLGFNPAQRNGLPVAPPAPAAAAAERDHEAAPVPSGLPEVPAATRIGHKNKETIVRLCLTPRSSKEVASAIGSNLRDTESLLVLLHQRGLIGYSNMKWSTR